jgi:hypothetical protein
MAAMVGGLLKKALAEQERDFVVRMESMSRAFEERADKQAKTIEAQASMLAELQQEIDGLGFKDRRGVRGAAL